MFFFSFSFFFIFHFFAIVGVCACVGFCGCIVFMRRRCWWVNLFRVCCLCDDVSTTLYKTALLLLVRRSLRVFFFFFAYHREPRFLRLVAHCAFLFLFCRLLCALVHRTRGRVTTDIIPHPSDACAFCVLVSLLNCGMKHACCRYSCFCFFYHRSSFCFCS